MAMPGTSHDLGLALSLGSDADSMNDCCDLLLLTILAPPVVHFSGQEESSSKPELSMCPCTVLRLGDEFTLWWMWWKPSTWA